MTTKGNKSTVATIGRELREVRGNVGEHAAKIGRAIDRLEAIEDKLGKLVDQVDESIDMLLGDAYSDRRHVAGLEDRIGVLEAPFWKRREERRLSTERRIARLREAASVARETAGRIAAPVDDQVVAEDLNPTEEQVGRVVELAGVAKVAKLKKSIDDGEVELRSPDDVPDPN